MIDNHVLNLNVSIKKIKDKKNAKTFDFILLFYDYL